jgi:hypothetical protein
MVWNLENAFYNNGSLRARLLIIRRMSHSRYYHNQNSEDEDDHENVMVWCGGGKSGICMVKRGELRGHIG